MLPGDARWAVHSPQPMSTGVPPLSGQPTQQYGDGQAGDRLSSGSCHPPLITAPGRQAEHS